MTIAIASDHAGLDLKNKIKEHLEKIGLAVEDFGTFKSESVDYPDYGILAARAVAQQRADLGILMCASGIGMSIIANKVRGIRAALCLTEKMAELSRRHNNANVLALPGKLIDHFEALKIVDVWLKTPFDGGRHLRRINKIHQLTGM
ncbi:MAG: ribose 5-phosphate isomerase B [Calditrichaeota bacterium]|nr:ribose 5-phosphate isomerase B [Calditrichota bacterium]